MIFAEFASCLAMAIFMDSLASQSLDQRTAALSNVLVFQNLGTALGSAIYALTLLPFRPKQIKQIKQIRKKIKEVWFLKSRTWRTWREDRLEYWLECWDPPSIKIRPAHPQPTPVLECPRKHQAPQAPEDWTGFSRPSQLFWRVLLCSSP